MKKIKILIAGLLLTLSAQLVSAASPVMASTTSTPPQTNGAGLECTVWEVPPDIECMSCTDGYYCCSNQASGCSMGRGAGGAGGWGKRKILEARPDL